jgi:hypothetical protein
MIGQRFVVFFLAFLSFACLLGTLYGVWPMHLFGLCVLLPSTCALVAIAGAFWHRPHGRENPATWIVMGALGGVIAAAAYDVFRLPFVLQGAPLFKVFPRFGELLLNATEPRWLVHALGWTYHFSNGAALGIMFLAAISTFRRPPLFWGAIGWAVIIEAALLLTPYAEFFGLKKDTRFLVLTASAHIVFGVALGSFFRRRAALLTGDPGNLA